MAKTREEALKIANELLKQPQFAHLRHNAVAPEMDPLALDSMYQTMVVGPEETYTNQQQMLQRGDDMRAQAEGGFYGGIANTIDAGAYLLDSLGASTPANYLYDKAAGWEQKAADVQSQISDPESLMVRTMGTTSMIPMIVPGLLGGAALGGLANLAGWGARLAPFIGGALGASEAAGAAGQKYRQLTAQGQPYDVARSAANRQFWTEAPLDIGSEMLLGMFSDAGALSKLIPNAPARKMIGEGLQEGFQETYQGLIDSAVQNAAGKSLPEYLQALADERKNIGKVAWEEGVPGALGGLIAGGLGAGGDIPQSRAQTAQQKQTAANVEKVVEATSRPPAPEAPTFTGPTLTKVGAGFEGADVTSGFSPTTTSTATIDLPGQVAPQGLSDIIGGTTTPTQAQPVVQPETAPTPGVMPTVEAPTTPVTTATSNVAKVQEAIAANMPAAPTVQATEEVASVPVERRGGTDENGNFVLGEDVKQALRDIVSINDMSVAPQNPVGAVPTQVPVQGTFSYQPQQTRGELFTNQPTQWTDRRQETQTKKQIAAEARQARADLTRDLIAAGYDKQTAKDNAEIAVRNWVRNATVSQKTNTPLTVRYQYERDKVQRGISPQENGQTYNQYIGQNGARNIDAAENLASNDKTSRMYNNWVAEQMEAAGKDERTILLATGWQRLTDGQWRYELPDGKFNTISDVRLHKLSQIYDDQKLYEAYPELKNMPVLFEDLDPREGGYVGRGANGEQVVVLNTNRVNTKTRELTTDGQKTLLHEIQHLVQFKEGFAQGGDETFGKIAFLSQYGSRIRRLEQWQEEHIPKARRQQWKTAVANYGKAVIQRQHLLSSYNNARSSENISPEAMAMSELQLQNNKDEIANAANELQRVYRELGEETANEARRIQEEATHVYGLEASDNFTKYWYLGGENEARNTANRLGMTEEERRDSPFDDTADIGHSDTINVYNNPRSAPLPTPSQTFNQSAPRSSEAKQAATLQETATQQTGQDIVELNAATVKDPESRAYLREQMLARGMIDEDVDAMLALLDGITEDTLEISKKYPLMAKWQEQEPERAWSKLRGLVPVRSAFKKNGEYPVNFDFGALCTKREAMDMLVQILASKGLTQQLGPTQIEALKSMLKDEGFLTACDICFVESKRVRMLNDANKTSYAWKSVLLAAGIDDDLQIGKARTLTDEQLKRLRRMASTGEKGEYLDAYKEYMPEERRRTKTKGDEGTDLDTGITPNTMGKIAKLFLQDAEAGDGRTTTLAGELKPDLLLSTAGTDWLVRTYGGHTNIYNTLAGMYGSATSKPLEGFNIFDNLSFRKDFDFKALSDNNKFLYDIGGSRSQSFTDFNPLLFLDYVQLISELQVRGMPMQVYTKVLSHPQLFGLTGMMINMSLVPDIVEGVDAEHAGMKPNGRGGWAYAWSEDSFPIKEAFALRKRKEYGGRVGTIAVGVSDAHILKMLSDPEIDMVIPYHSSGMPFAVKIKTGLIQATDYTDVQETKNVPTGQRFNYNEALQRLGDPRKAANEYLQWCKDIGATPRFPQFANHENYYKLLEDFRGYDNAGKPVIQGPVRLNLPKNWKQTLDAALADRTKQVARMAGMANNKTLMKKALAILKPQRLDGELRENMMKRLKKLLGASNVVTMRQTEFLDALEASYGKRMGAGAARSQVEVFRQGDGVVYGFADNGKIVLNELTFNANTPAHEFTHVWAKVAQMKNAELWAEGKELLKQHKLWDEVANDPMYKNIAGNEDAIASEVLARFVGQQNEDFIRSMLDPTVKMQRGNNLVQQIRDWFMRMFEEVRSLFSKDNKQPLTFDEFIRMPMKTLWTGDLKTIKEAAQDRRFQSAVKKLQKQGEVTAVDAQTEMMAAAERMTQTPEFKRWFGDSKVVDENGEPLVVYHGTGTPDITEFKHSKATDKTGRMMGLGQGKGKFYFTSNRTGAETAASAAVARGQGKTATVMPVYLRLTNPISLAEYESRYEKLSGHPIFESYSGNYTSDVRDKYIAQLDRAIKKEGYDGIVGEDRGLYVAFSPNQIKSVNNRGTFDSSANIFNQPAWHGSPHVFDKFDLGAMGSGEGAQVHGWGLYFTADKKVGEGYRERLSRRGDVAYNFTVDGKSLDPELSRLLTNELGGSDLYQGAEGNMKPIKEGISLLRAHWKKEIDWYNGIIDGLQEQIEKIKTTPKLSITAFSKQIAELPYDIKWRAESCIESARKQAKAEKRRATIEDVQKALDSSVMANTLLRDKWNKKLQKISTIKTGDLKVSAPGSLFEVDVPENNVLLDEQKKMSEQPASVKRAAAKLAQENGIQLTSDETGRKFYHDLSRVLGGPKEASLALNDNGVKGITYVGGLDGRCFVVFDDKAVSTINRYNQEVAKDIPQDYSDLVRAQIKIENNGGTLNDATITLFSTADRSSFIHEFGHKMLDDVISLGTNPDAGKVFADDLKTVMDWFGVKDVSEIGVEQHEQFARGFERYLMEGKAPTSKLSEVFEHFKQWLVDIYKHVSGLDVELSPEIRDLFDRLLGKDIEEQSTGTQSATITGPTLTERGAAFQTQQGRDYSMDYATTGTQATPTPTPASVKKSRATIREIFDRLREIRPVRKGVQAPKEVLGYTDPQRRVARTRWYGDWVTATHEIGHIVDYQLKLRQKVDSKLSAKIDRELQQFGLNTSPPGADAAYLRKEGIAEFFRLYAILPDLAEQAAPEYSKLFQETLADDSDLKSKVDGIFEVSREYWALTPEEKIRAGLRQGDDQPKSKGIVQKVINGWEQFREQFDDRLRRIEKIQNVMRDRAVAEGRTNMLQNGQLKDEYAPYDMFRTAPGFLGKAKRDIQAIMDPIMKIGTEAYDSLVSYMTAKRAIDYWNNDMEPGIATNRQQTEDFIAQFEKDHGDLVKISQDIAKAYEDMVRRTMIDSGVWSEAQYEAYKKKWPNYVPFLRVSEDGQVRMPGKSGGNGVVNLDNQVKQAKGVKSEHAFREIEDPYESMVKNILTYHKIAEKNRVGQSLVAAAEADPSLFADLIEPIKPGERSKDSFYVWKDGKRQWYAADKDILDAITSLEEVAPDNIISKVATKAANALKLGATRANPAFIITNFIRDAMYSTMTNSGWGVPFYNTIKGLAMQLSKDPKMAAQVAEALDAGLAYSGITELGMNSSRESVARSIKKAIGDDGFYAKFANSWVGRFINGIGETNEMIELAPKFAEYQRLVKQGYPKRYAARMAREVNIDFSRGGSVGKAANRYIAFFNPAIQGVSKISRTAAANPGKFLAKTALYVMLPSLISWAMGHDDDEYKRMSRSIKDRYWVFKGPGGTWVRIAKPDLVGLVGSTMERMLDKAADKDPAAFRGLGTSIKEAAFPSYMPTVLGPIMEHISNRNFFYGETLIPQSLQNLPPEMQYQKNTSSTAKFLGKMWGISPIIIDNYIKGYGGGVAETIAKAPDLYDQYVSKTGEEKKIGEMPIISRFTVDPYRSSESISRFYDLKRQTDVAKNGFKALAKQGERGEVNRDVKAAKMFEKAGKQISEWNKDIARIREAKNLTPEQKRQRIDRINLERNKLAEKVLARYDAME